MEKIGTKLMFERRRSVYRICEQSAYVHAPTPLPYRLRPSLGCGGLDIAAYHGEVRVERLLTILKLK